MNDAASIIGLVIVAVSMLLLIVAVSGFVIWKLRHYANVLKEQKRA